MPGDKFLIKTISRHPFYLGAAAIALILTTLVVNFRKQDISEDISAWGQFGDFLGGTLNPLFGLISVVIISATLQLQIKSSRKQEFDNQFFALLNLYDSVLQSIDRHSSRDGSVRKGRDCMYLFFRDVIKISEKNKIPLNIAYSSFFESRGWELEHYFRTVYHLFKHVKDGSNGNLVVESEKKKYYDLIKSQISQYELIIIWLNCQSQHKGKWDSLINDEHSDPFEHLNKSLLNNAHLLNLDDDRVHPKPQRNSSPRPDNRGSR